VRLSSADFDLRSITPATLTRRGINHLVPVPERALVSSSRRLSPSLEAAARLRPVRRHATLPLIAEAVLPRAATNLAAGARRAGAHLWTIDVCPYGPEKGQGVGSTIRNEPTVVPTPSPMVNPVEIGIEAGIVAMPGGNPIMLM
jgi:hypothetical protein